MKKGPRTKHLAAPPWSDRAVIDAARRLTARYEAIVGRDHVLRNGLHFDDVYDRLLYPEFKVDLYEDEDLGADAAGRKLLGRYDVRANAARLDRVISRDAGDPRRAFTCWHEVAGHGVLQGGWLRKQLDGAGGRESVDVTEYSLSAAAEEVLERQANLFASHMAAPDWLVNYAVNKTFRPTRAFEFREPCVYWLDVQGLRLKKYVVDAGDLCGWIGAKVSGYFGGLSADAIGYRLRDLGWVRDLSVPDLRLHRAVRAGRPAGATAAGASATPASPSGWGGGPQAPEPLFQHLRQAAPPLVVV